jgi:16S rRNA (adenine1518-N6/adenine1519-N6)-dimethyltransferase
MGIKSSLDADGLAPRKKWGQNFLTDPRILESIVDSGAVTSADTILEIGPGLGHLTRVLARRAGRVVAVEVDADLAKKLQSELAELANVDILQGDFMSRGAVEWLQATRAGFDPAHPFKLVANIPYYITSAILRQVLEATIKPQVVVVMVQRQVAQRMVAKPPEMSLLAISVQFFSQVRILRTIAAGAFYPRPQVESAVVRLDVYDRPPVEVADPARFFQLVHAGFGERRKQLRNSLARGLGLDSATASILLTRSHIDPTRRAETLKLDEWGALYREWVRVPIAGVA